MRPVRRVGFVVSSIFNILFRLEFIENSICILFMQIELKTKINPNIKSRLFVFCLCFSSSSFFFLLLVISERIFCMRIDFNAKWLACNGIVEMCRAIAYRRAIASSNGRKTTHQITCGKCSLWWRFIFFMHRERIAFSVNRCQLDCVSACLSAFQCQSKTLLFTFYVMFQIVNGNSLHRISVTTIDFT